MKKNINILLLVCSIVFFTCHSFGAQFKFSPSIQYVTGTTSYDIEFPFWDWGYRTGESKLEFDIDAVMLNLGVEGVFLNERVFVSFNASQTVLEQGGDLRDRDWIDGTLDGDTLSDVDSEGEIYDLMVKVNFLRPGKSDFIRLNLFTGYQIQSWGKFEAKNIDGYYKGYLTWNGRRYNINETFSSPVLTYEVDYETLYFGFGADLNVTRKFAIQSALKLGFTQVEDKDDHILRQKIANGEADGFMFDFNVEACWNFHKRMSLSGFLHYLTIVTEGEQVQYFYDAYGNKTDYIGEVNTEITTDQLYVGAKFNVKI